MNDNDLIADWLLHNKPKQVGNGGVVESPILDIIDYGKMIAGEEQGVHIKLRLHIKEVTGKKCSCCEEILNVENIIYKNLDACNSRTKALLCKRCVMLDSYWRRIIKKIGIDRYKRVLDIDNEIVTLTYYHIDYKYFSYNISEAEKMRQLNKKNAMKAEISKLRKERKRLMSSNKKVPLVEDTEKCIIDNEYFFRKEEDFDF